jgi:hypothetical protein
MPAADTSVEADSLQVDAYRRMGSAGRARVLFSLTCSTRRLAEAVIRRRHPEYDAAQVKLALARLLYGDALVHEAWPDLPLLQP